MSAQFPSVAVVILNWNGKHFLEKFLPSVLGSDYPNLEVVVGDNASRDDSAGLVKERFPAVKLLENDRNYGFAGGYNRVLRQVKADYFVLLNSDVEVPPGWIRPVIDLMEAGQDIAACQPKLKEYERKRYFEYAGAAGGYIDRYGYPFCRGRVFDTVEEDQGQYDRPGEVFWAGGAALFIKSRYWQEAGGLDEDLFAHMEEIDLCWRLHHLGHKIMVCPQSEVYHVGGGTLQKINPRKTYLNFRNNLIILHKNLPASGLYPVVFIRLCLDLMAWVKFLAAGRFRHALALNKAHWSYFLGLRRWNRKRKQIRPGKLPATVYRKSIVYQYFIKQKRKFSELPVQSHFSGS